MKIDFPPSPLQKTFIFPASTLHCVSYVTISDHRNFQCLCASVKFKIKQKVWQNFPLVASTFINSVHARKNFYHNHLDGDFLFHGILVRGHCSVSLSACLLRNYLDGGNLIHFLANEFQSDCSPKGRKLLRKLSPMLPLQYIGNLHAHVQQVASNTRSLSIFESFGDGKLMANVRRLVKNLLQFRLPSMLSSLQWWTWTLPMNSFRERYFPK